MEGLEYLILMYTFILVDFILLLITPSFFINFNPDLFR